MGSADFDPGGGNHPSSYANSVRKKKYEKLKRNVLLIVVEKKMQSQIVNLNGDLVASTLQILR